MYIYKYRYIYICLSFVLDLSCSLLLLSFSRPHPSLLPTPRPFPLCLSRVVPPACPPFLSRSFSFFFSFSLFLAFSYTQTFDVCRLVQSLKLTHICLCVAVCCSVLQCVAVCCGVYISQIDIRILTPSNPDLNLPFEQLQHTATHSNTLQHTATHSNTQQHIATHSITQQHTVTHCNILQYSATHCNTPYYNTLQHTATECGKAHCLAYAFTHTATHCNILQHMQHTATHCNTPYYNTLQHTATESWQSTLVGICIHSHPHTLTHTHSPPSLGILFLTDDPTVYSRTPPLCFFRGLIPPPLPSPLPASNPVCSICRVLFLLFSPVFTTATLFPLAVVDLSVTSPHLPPPSLIPLSHTLSLS